MGFIDKKVVFIFLLACFVGITQSYAATEVAQIKEGLVHDDYLALKKCADNGDRLCSRNIGIFYAYKFRLPDGSVSQNLNSAKVWLEKSTFYPSARFVLGNLYIESNENLKEGEILLLSSCSDYNISACEKLYDLYTSKNVKDISCTRGACEKLIHVLKNMISIASKDSSLGELFEKDYVGRYNIELAKILIKRSDPSVVPLLEREVSNDTAFATVYLAPLYEKGELVPRNFVRAYMMYDLTGTGYADEKAKLAARMTPEQVREAQEMSWRWQDEHRSYRAGYRGSDMGVQWKLEQR